MSPLAANILLWLIVFLLLLALMYLGWRAWTKSRASGADSAPANLVEPVVPAPPIAKAAETPAVVAPVTPPPVTDAPTAPAATGAPTAIGIPAAVGAPDNLLQLKGVGPKLNTLLQSLGVARFDQIAAWSAEDIAKVDAHLGAFKGRISRDNWVAQAKLLATGAVAEFEARFGKLDSENK